LKPNQRHRFQAWFSFGSKIVCPMLVVPHHIEQTKSCRNSAASENRYLWFDYRFISGSENVAPSKKKTQNTQRLRVYSFLFEGRRRKPSSVSKLAQRALKAKIQTGVAPQTC
jgi:hypothetical protein